jgi:thymidylate kinase
VLRRLQLEDPEKCRDRAEKLIGKDGADQVDACITADAELDVSTLRQRMLHAHKVGVLLKLKEALRIVRRVLYPTGFSLAVLGPDGVGKSTVIDGLRRTLLPAFRRTVLMHFRPYTFEPNRDGPPNTNPHGVKPRAAPLALAKVFYYYFDHLVGHFTKVRPLKCRSSLVIFDRSYDDLIVDPLRFRIGGFRQVTRVLRKMLPKHDLAIVLDASPGEMIVRKQELSLDELARQRDVFARLAAKESNYLVIDAGRDPDEVLASCYAAVVDRLAQRLNR